MIKSLTDSAIGIYGVLVKPNMPKVAVLIAVAIGVLVGLFWGYNVDGTVFYNGDPSTLQQTWQNEWVKLLADRYALPTDRDISASIIDLLGKVDDPEGIVEALRLDPNENENAQRLANLSPLAQAAQPNAANAPRPDDFLTSLRPFLIAPILMVVASIIWVVVYNLLLQPVLVDPIRRRLRGEKVSKEVIEARNTQREQDRILATRKTDFQATTDFGPPLMQRMSTYRLGIGEYDESYEIEDAEGNFLGQTGAVVSELDGVGDPGKAMAIEVWLFDKDDFVRTLTKVYASPYAFNDPAIRAQLQERGDVVMVQPGALITLETNALRLQATIVEVEYGTGALPPNSFFQKMTIELASWRKTGGNTGVPMVAAVYAVPPSYTPAPTFDPVPAYQPPPPQPVYQPPMPSVQPTYQPPIPQQPISYPDPGFSAPPPPPTLPGQMGRAVPPDDDPFGGTGDFSPVG